MPMTYYGNEPIVRAQAALNALRRVPVRLRPKRRRKVFLSFLVKFPALYIKEVCALLGINLRTIKRWSKDPAFRAAYLKAQQERFEVLYAMLDSQRGLTPTQKRTMKCYLFNFDPNYGDRISRIHARRQIIRFLLNHRRLF